MRIHVQVIQNFKLGAELKPRVLLNMLIKIQSPGHRREEDDFCIEYLTERIFRDMFVILIW